MDSTQQNEHVNISVFAYKPEAPDSTVILFSISVTSRMNNTWILEKRFSQFDKLQLDLKQYFGDTLPQLPKKSYISFFVGKTHDDIEQRRIGLDNYLKNLVVRSEVFNSLPLREFLELDKHCSDAVVNPPQLLVEIKEIFTQVLNKVGYHSYEGVMFVINSDTNFLTRIDAYMTNMKMPWESEQGGQTLIPVSCAECWTQNEQGEFERQWTKLYNSQAICLFWEYKTCTLLVGLDSGSINLLVVPQKDNQFKRYEESMEIEQHLDRVMGLYFDPERSLVHSVSKDKKYRVLDLNKQALIADYEPSNFELTYMLVSNERKRSFVGDKCGSIFIFDISETKPQALVHLPTTNKTIRGLYLDNMKNYLFALGFEEGDISVFDIGKPGRENTAKEVAKLKNKPKSREICWSGKRGEIYVGNFDGTITVWEAKKASPIYVIKAHESDITKLTWKEDEQILLSSGKDKILKAWKMPNSWRDKQALEQEERERAIEEKTQNMIQMQKKLKKAEIDSGDEDELCTWHQ